ncbi:unnamed protein product, partial [Meganyctiphanes norvegica]
EWPKLILVLGQMLYEKHDKSYEAELVVKKIIFWLRKAISAAGYNEDVKTKLQALLANIQSGVTGKLDPMDILVGFIRVLFFPDDVDIYNHIKTIDWEGIKVQLMKISSEAPSSPDHGLFLQFKLYFWIQKALKESLIPDVSDGLQKILITIETSIKNGEDPVKTLSTVKEEVEGPK